MNADVKGGGKLLLLSKYITEEDLSTQSDGSNLQYTLSNNYSTGTIRLFLNGLRLQKGIGNDYIESGINTIDFFIAPDSEETVLVDYIKI